MPLSTIISAANSTDSFFSKDKGFLSGLGLNSTFSSTMGGSTSFIAGTGRTTNIYSSERKTVHNLAEMARFLYNNNQMGGALGFLFGFLTNEGGGDTAYVFGNKKALTYRFTPNFTVDRFCNTQGLIGKQKKGLVADISFQPKNNKKRYMVLAAFFSTVLLAFDLVLFYKLKYMKTADKTLKVSITMTYMATFEFLCLMIMRMLEKKFFNNLKVFNDLLPEFKEKVERAETAFKIAKEALTDAAAAAPQGIQGSLAAAQATVDQAKLDCISAKTNLENHKLLFESTFGSAGL
jgi:hypothetical protein